MKEPQEFHPIDDFYRKVLESPAQNSSNPGWDVPSSQVWENVQKGVRPVGGLWLKMLGAAAAVGIVAAAVFFFNRPADPTTNTENNTAPTLHQPTDQPATPAIGPASTPSESSSPAPANNPAIKASEPAKKQPATDTPAAKPRVNHSQPNNSEPPAPATYNNPGTSKSVEPANAQPAPVLPEKVVPNAQDNKKAPLKNTPPPRNHREENAKPGGQH
ncbi:MAG: hypothetical protein ACK4Q5_12930 [Saprospiraceae bacterium]